MRVQAGMPSKSLFSFSQSLLGSRMVFSRPSGCCSVVPFQSRPLVLLCYVFVFLWMLTSSHHTVIMLAMLCRFVVSCPLCCTVFLVFASGQVSISVLSGPFACAVSRSTIFPPPSSRVEPSARERPHGPCANADQREYLGCGHLRWLATKHCEKYKQYGQVARCEPKILEFEDS